MGLCNSSNIFQERIDMLMGDLMYVRAYIDNILALTKGSYTIHIDKLEKFEPDYNSKDEFLCQNRTWIFRVTGLLATAYSQYLRK